MAYATQQDIAEIYGEELLYILADRDRDQVLDTAAIASSLDKASGEIDAKLSVRYVVPFAEPSADITRICIDIAVYRLALAADAWTVEIERRYKLARGDLKDMAEGDAGTGIPAEPGQGSEIRGGEALISANERLFTRHTMRGL